MEVFKCWLGNLDSFIGDTGEPWTTSREGSGMDVCTEAGRALLDSHPKVILLSYHQSPLLCREGGSYKAVSSRRRQFLQGLGRDLPMSPHQR